MPLVEALHGMAATVWVGGIFFAYMALRPAANIALDPPHRLRLWQATYSRFFPWVWLMIGILLATGYTDLYVRFGGIGTQPLYLELMHGTGLIMIAAFAYLYFGLYRKLTRAIADDDMAAAASVMAKARPIMATNLILGLLNTAIGIAGPNL